MRRRDVLRVLAFAPWVVHAQAQQPRKIWRIAFVYPTRAPATVSERTPGVQALFAELQRLGYVEQDNLLVERYPADGHSERLPSLASEAAQANPDLIFALSGRAMLAVKRATDRFPVVGMSSDPIAYGIVTSLSRPEGNITGVIVDAGAELWGKRLEILKEAAPRIRKVFQVTPRASFDSGVFRTAVEAAAQRTGVAVVGPPIDSPAEDLDYRRAFDNAVASGADAGIVSTSPENFSKSRFIVALAEEARLPTIYPSRDFTAVGGLIAYDINTLDLFRQVARQIDAIFKGARPSDVPFYQPTKFELVINLKTAAALGLTIPPTLLARADEVIE